MLSNRPGAHKSRLGRQPTTPPRANRPSHYDNEYVQTFKAELQVELDRKQKWGITPLLRFL
jgi:hypothetical protein